MLEAQELVAVGWVERPHVGEVEEDEDLHLVGDISGGLRHQPINGMVRISNLLSMHSVICACVLHVHTHLRIHLSD